MVATTLCGFPGSSRSGEKAAIDLIDLVSIDIQPGHFRPGTRELDC